MIIRIKKQPRNRITSKKIGSPFMEQVKKKIGDGVKGDEVNGGRQCRRRLSERRQCQGSQYPTPSLGGPQEDKLTWKANGIVNTTCQCEEVTNKIIPLRGHP
ncbi:hypothetical protein QJS10_CPB15g00761 [Acorus calamus]|uniref:Uncharacterized protein n=1 Tax=Acorus calamus TaxID=4465 RepID=A0AAV9D928_ACOCL|nr:hypothetical protein QJS10_CPB15g00761 [Acorus calamus]